MQFTLSPAWTCDTGSSVNTEKVEEEKYNTEIADKFFKPPWETLLYCWGFVLKIKKQETVKWKIKREQDGERQIRQALKQGWRFEQLPRVSKAERSSLRQVHPPVEPFLTVPTSEMEPSTCVERRWAWLMGYIFAFWPDWELHLSAPRPSARLTRSLCYGSYGWGRLPLSNGPLSWLWWYNLVEVWKRKSCWCSSMGGRFKWKIVLIRMEQTVWR